MWQSIITAWGNKRGDIRRKGGGIEREYTLIFAKIRDFISYRHCSKTFSISNLELDYPDNGIILLHLLKNTLNQILMES